MIPTRFQRDALAVVQNRQFAVLDRCRWAAAQGLESCALQDEFAASDESRIMRHQRVNALLTLHPGYDIDPHPASSRERLVASITALVSTGSRPSSPIRTASAAAVVPPGDVTFCRSVAGSSDERCSNSPEPATVARASLLARSAGRPAAAPARARASASRNT